MKRIMGAVVSACVASSAQAASLTADQLRAELVGKPLSWKSVDSKISGKSLYATDGSATLSDSTIPNIGTDQGTWKINGSRMCLTWKKLRAGKEVCFTVEKMSDGSFKTSHKLILIP